MRPRPLAAGFAVALVLALPAAAAHAEQITFGPEDGVRAVQVSGERVVVRFTGRSARALKRVRGRYVETRCENLPARDGRIHSTGPGAPGASSSASSCRAAGRESSSRALAAPTCASSPATGPKRTLYVSVPVTEDGRTYLDEMGRAGMIFLAVEVAAELARKAGGTGWPRADALSMAAEGFVVGLPAPDAPVPMDRVGYWTDGARHFVVAVTTAAGRRLYYEELDAETVRTNLFGSGSWLFSGAE